MDYPPKLETQNYKTYRRQQEKIIVTLDQPKISSIQHQNHNSYKTNWLTELEKKFKFQSSNSWDF